MNMKRVLALILAGIMLLGAAGVAVFAADSGVATINGTSYATLQLALDAISDCLNVGTIQLQCDVDDEVVVEADAYVDLNGYDIKKVTVIDGTLYVTDSQTTDFVAQTEADYGIIAAYEGDVQAFCTPEEDGAGWLMFDDNGSNASFHYVVLQITDMVLRPQNEGEETYNPSLYYKCAFKGDEVVAQNVKTFGVALSVVEAPTAANLKTVCGYTVFEGFQSGENGNPEQNTGSILKNIMKESNASLVNNRNANLPIFGRAYVELINGDYVFGECRTRTLKEQTQKALNRWTLLNTNSEEDNVKKAALKELVKRYPSVMQSWNLPNLDVKYNDVVYDAATWYEEFQNLPVVNVNMTVDEMRQLVVDAFRLQLSYKWTPDSKYVYMDYEDDYTTLDINRVYKGTPYVMNTIYFDRNNDGTVDDDEKSTGVGPGTSNLFKVLNYYDPATGVVKLSEMGSVENINNTLVNNCSGGLFWALGRVSNARKFHTSQHYVPANGALPVGRVKVDEAKYTQISSSGEILFYSGAIKAMTTFTGGRNPIGQSKGDYYKSYAELQPGDVLVTDGHVRMCTGVDVVRDESGTIIQAQSYVWYIDQRSDGSTDRYYTHWLTGRDFTKKHTYTQDNGYTVYNLGCMIDDPVYGTKVSFQELLGDHYLPVTIPEFLTTENKTAAEVVADYRDNTAAAYFAGTDREADWEAYKTSYNEVIADCGVEKGTISTYNELETWTSTTPSRLFGKGGEMLANYAMSDFRVAVLAPNGTVLAEEIPMISTGDRSHRVKINTVTKALQVLTQDKLNEYGGQGNRLLIEVRLSTGEWLTILNANLSKNA